ncbi:hypothetical protein [Actinokineospora pegani]|uniref:hypothetical protein n=1 Tax=Actinokineospora pegani TaxID=2654637 RepID=UPI0012EA0A96|nr:hypothetical protein [Actinokineospora pegani]
MLRSYIVRSWWRQSLLVVAAVVALVSVGVLLEVVFNVATPLRAVVLIIFASIAGRVLIRRGWVWVDQGGLDIVPVLGAKTWVPWNQVVGLEYEPTRSRLPGRVPVLRTVEGDLPLSALSFVGEPPRKVRRLAETVARMAAAA